MTIETPRLETTLPLVGHVSINFYGASKDLYDLYDLSKEFTRQKTIKQLGIIPDVFEGVTHNRFEYLMMQCAIADILDNLHKGDSLSQGSIVVDGERLNGNSIIKSWFLLSNYGHTKYTYGDEKALHIFALKRKGFKSTLLSIVNDAVLREWCESSINSFEFTKFHYVISAYRVYKELKRNIDKKNKIIKLLKLLLIDINRLDVKVNVAKLIQLRGIFSRIRDLTIVSLDGHYSHLPINIDLLSSLVSFDNIEGGVLGREFSETLNPIRSFLYEGVYLDKNVLARQRAFELGALSYLYKQPQNNTSYKAIITEALTKGFYNPNTKKLIHFCRFKITKEMQPGTSFFDEFRSLTIKSRTGCFNTQSYLDFNPYTGDRYADFFLDEDFNRNQLPAFIYNICSLIHDQIRHLGMNKLRPYNDLFTLIKTNAENSGIDKDVIKYVIEGSSLDIYLELYDLVDKQVFHAYRRLLWSFINYFIESNYRLELDAYNTKYRDCSIYIIGTDKTLFEHSFINAHNIERKTDLNRAHELSFLMKSAKRHFEGYKIACLCRASVVDLTKKPSERKVTDIDGILLKVSKERVILELLEAKNNSSRNSRSKEASADIRAKLIPILNKNARGIYRVSPITNMGAKLIISC